MTPSERAPLNLQHVDKPLVFETGCSPLSFEVIKTVSVEIDDLEDLPIVGAELENGDQSEDITAAKHALAEMNTEEYSLSLAVPLKPDSLFRYPIVIQENNDAEQETAVVAWVTAMTAAEHFAIPVNKFDERQLAELANSLSSWIESATALNSDIPAKDRADYFNSAVATSSLSTDVLQRARALYIDRITHLRKIYGLWQFVLSSGTEKQQLDTARVLLDALGVASPFEGQQTIHQIYKGIRFSPGTVGDIRGQFIACQLVHCLKNALVNQDYLAEEELSTLDEILIHIFDGLLTTINDVDQKVRLVRPLWNEIASTLTNSGLKDHTEKVKQLIYSYQGDAVYESLFGDA